MTALSNRLQEFLKRIGATRPNPTDTNFDPNFESGVNAGIRDITTQANYLDQDAIQDRLERIRQERELAESRDEATTGLQENMADRGILRSGATLEQQGKIGKNYQRGVDEVSRNIANRGQNREREFEQAQNRFQTEFEQLRLERSRRQAERDEERNREKAELEARAQAAQPVALPTGQYQAPQPQSLSMYEGQAFDPNDPDALQAILRRLGRL